MKRFHELNKTQKNEAVNYAMRELQSLMDLGVVVIKQEMTDSLMREYAICGAETAWYSEKDDKVIPNVAN